MDQRVDVAGGTVSGKDNCRVRECSGGVVEVQDDLRVCPLFPLPTQAAINS